MQLYTRQTINVEAIDIVGWAVSAQSRPHHRNTTNQPSHTHTCAKVPVNAITVPYAVPYTLSAYVPIVAACLVSLEHMSWKCRHSSRHHVGLCGESDDGECGFCTCPSPLLWGLGGPP